MADNVDITPGTGATVATDEVDGRHYQRMKLTDGAEGSDNHASVRADGTQEVSISDLAVALWAILEALTRPIFIDPSTGRLRVSIDGAGAQGAVSLGNIATVTTVSSMTQLQGGNAGDILCKPLDRNLWNNSVRMRIS